MLPSIAMLATVSGMLSAFLPAIQIRDMWQRRNSGGLAVPFLLGIIVNLGIWTAYSASMHKQNMVYTNGAALGMNAAMLIVVLLLRRRCADVVALSEEPAHEPTALRPASAAA
jgi:Na+/proline symporter